MDGSADKTRGCGLWFVALCMGNCLQIVFFRDLSRDNLRFLFTAEDLHLASNNLDTACTIPQS